MAIATITGKDIRRSKAVKYLGVGISMLLLGMGMGGGYSFNKMWQYNERKEKLESLIGKSDYEAARTLISTLSGKGLLSLEDRLLLQFEIEKNEGRDKFYTLISEGKLDEATRLVKKFKDEWTHSQGGIGLFEKKLAQLSEENLYEQMARSSIYRRGRDAQEYLKYHGQGKHREEAISYVLAGSLEGTVALAKQDASFSLVHSSLKDLGGSLSKHKDQGIKLPVIHSVDEVISLMREYVERGSLGENLVTGSYVVVNRNAENNRGGKWNVMYQIERQKNFPVGSKGRVVQTGDNIHIEFPNAKKIYWSNMWGLERYRLREKNNVGAYKESELDLRVVSRFTPPERELLMKEIQKVESLLKQYMGRS